MVKNQEANIDSAEKVKARKSILLMPNVESERKETEDRQTEELIRERKE